MSTTDAKILRALSGGSEHAPIAYACSAPEKLNHLVSARQYNNALPKNRADHDVPLYGRPATDAEPVAWMDAEGCLHTTHESAFFRGQHVTPLYAHPPAPQGWKLVPVEPTDKMTFIGQSLRYDAVNGIGEIYRQMLAAAPGAEG